MTLVRCRTCCYPSTKPDLHFDETGQCAACRNFQSRPTIDWEARESELVRLIEAAPKNSSGYTAIVPSSGGKDSTAQTLKLIELGARPLVVTASTCYLTPIGRRNIENLARYATTIEVTPKRTVRAKLNKLGLEMVGDVSHAEHMSIFSTPFRVARDLGISQIWYGEAPQREYGGPPGSEEAQTMTRRWIAEYGGLLGARASDFVGLDGITEEDMEDYRLPDDEDMATIDAYFIGSFSLWDSKRNAEISIAHGMEARLPSPANWWPAENLDCALTGLHDHGMYRKYGYGRLCAQISVDIRNGRISRREAMEIVEGRDGLFPETYAGVSVDEVLSYMGVTRRWLMAQLDKHTNWDLFARVVGGRPILKEWEAVECSPAE